MQPGRAGLILRGMGGLGTNGNSRRGYFDRISEELRQRWRKRKELTVGGADEQTVSEEALDVLLRWLDSAMKNDVAELFEPGAIS